MRRLHTIGRIVFSTQQRPVNSSTGGVDRRPTDKQLPSSPDIQTMQQATKSPMALIILDGWGHREDTRDNAIANGNTPTWDRLWSRAPHTLLSASGLDVGLPGGQFGNSEVGHMSLGAGRVVYQSISRIDKAISDGSF
jgi:hypothetical protein